MATVTENPEPEAPADDDAPAAMAAAHVPDNRIDRDLHAAFELADEIFMDWADDLKRVADRLKTDDAACCDEAVKVARGLRTAVNNMYEERNRVDRLRRQVAGVAGGAGTLDLDAARDEIGRRLACLRRAGGG